ncbi:supernatant protein factor C-terminal domain-containing protein [Basidiobolus meristosporus CBS 931.73]|uniref:Supernatant protein factor C-terminal domain-containing protein n=1 Tax=Basidiobolus meristosporus CBS 931.73 TaxID=1314790 RepID=A0A1Y1XB94_9FUNG|nr:supernatant protein factor C-terminal domain-containing protein [Basidiobolus meristosporus CBS 931.73]|eukprot:ORX83009.1 supernatant protein factor C-terminal domain-containing protein [Basidiobolus meristosporus CBS 931.73]
MKIVYPALLCGLYLADLIAGYSIYVQPRSAECFFEELKKDEKITVSYEVGGAGHYAVDFKMVDPQGRVIQNLRDRPSGQVTVEVAIPGKFTYCFQNEDSNMVEKTVLWNIHGLERDSATPEKENEEGTWWVVSGEMNPIEIEIAKLAEGIYQIKDQQEYMVTREESHRNTAESTNSRVKWWYVFQSGVLVGMCAFQIYYLKHFFESKRTV